MVSGLYHERSMHVDRCSYMEEISGFVFDSVHAKYHPHYSVAVSDHDAFGGVYIKPIPAAVLPIHCGLDGIELVDDDILCSVFDQMEGPAISLDVCRQSDHELDLSSVCSVHSG